MSTGRCDAAPTIPALFFLEDRAGQFTAADVVDRRDAFRPLKNDRLEAGYSRSVFWLRVELPARPAGAQRIVIEAGTPVVDRIDMYTASASGAPLHQASGDGVAFAQRGYPHRRPSFVLEAGAAPPTTVLLRVATQSTAIVPVTVWREADFLASAAADDLRYGLYFGALAALLGFNFLLFFAVRDPSYLWYVAYMAGLILLQAKLLGYADEYLWPTAPQLANPVNQVAFASMIGFGAQFSRSFLAGAPTDRWTAPAFIGLQVASAISVVALAVVPFIVTIQAMLAIALLSAILTTAIILRAFLRGFQAARYILLGIGVLIAGGVPYMLRAAGLLGDGFPAAHALDVATVTEALLLAFALADRINVLRAERAAAEVSLREAQLRFTERLIEGQDGDRRRIAGELHDALGQNILVLRNRLLALLRRSEPAPSGAELKTLADVTGEMTEQVRRMARDLHPPELERLGLRAALDGMLRRVTEDSGLGCRCEVTTQEADIAAERRVHVYRIAQEAVSNVVRHASARSIVLALNETDGGLRLSVEDDGVGPSFVADDTPSGFGLANIRERVRLIGGSLRIDQAASGGTRLTVVFAKGGAP